MKRIKLGDVFEIEITQGKAYFQYVFNNEMIGELIRVLPGIFETQFNDLPQLVNGETEYFIHFPVKAACKQKIIKFVGNYDLPNSLSIPNYFRDDKRDRDGNLIGWQIVNYETWKRETVYQLTEEQKKLSPWGTWNDTFLIDRISEKWTLDKWV
jgi:hypothetical protein